MQYYTGKKIIKATPMTRGEYNRYRGWELPFDEDPQDKGMLVEYLDGGDSNHPNHSNYISWSPLEVFDKAYLGFSAEDVDADWVKRLKADLAENREAMGKLAEMVTKVKDGGVVEIVHGSEEAHLLDLQLQAMTALEGILRRRAELAGTN